MSPVAELSPDYRFTAPPRFAHYCTSAVNRLSDRFWEARYHVNTRGGAPSPHSDAHHYGYLAYHTYFSIFDRLELTPDDVVVDLGCGKGRVVCIAATYRVDIAIGIEIDPPLWAVATENGDLMRGRRSPIRFLCRSAVNFDYDQASVIMMFHPFGADTMRAVLEQWERSLQRRPRTLRIAYSNPLLSPMLAAKSWLQLTECWQPRTWSRLKFPVHFYRTVSA